MASINLSFYILANGEYERLAFGETQRALRKVTLLRLKSVSLEERFALG